METVEGTTIGQTYNTPDPEDHYWGWVRDLKHEKRDKRCENSYKFMVKNGMDIKVKPTKTINVIETEYWGFPVKVSLKSWSFKFPNRKWFKAYKKLWGLNTTIDRGKYKGYKVKDIVEKDPQYIKWAIETWNEIFRVVVWEKLNLTKD